MHTRPVTAGLLLAAALSFGCATARGEGAGSAPPPQEPSSSGPFVSQRLGISDRTAAGCTAEVQLVLDNPGPGTMRIHAGDYVVTLAGDQVAKGDVILEQTAEVGERQGVVIPAKVDLGERLASLGKKKLSVRVKGALHVSQRGDRDMLFDVSLEVPGESLVIH
jgi:hypothetical protein